MWNINYKVLYEIQSKYIAAICYRQSLNFFKSSQLCRIAVTIDSAFLFKRQNRDLNGINTKRIYSILKRNTVLVVETWLELKTKLIPGCDLYKGGTVSQCAYVLLRITPLNSSEGRPRSVDSTPIHCNRRRMRVSTGS